MKFYGVIPARLASSRLPNKVLADIDGQPMLWYVWQRASEARGLDGVCVATDSFEIKAAVERWGGQALMTSPACRSGTERIASVINQIDGDVIINVQGDEPLIEPDLLDSVVENWQSLRADIVTPVYAITHVEYLLSPDVVKVIRAMDGRALYFSRSAIPHSRDVQQQDWLDKRVYWGHVGVYAYRRDVLEDFSSLRPSPLEAAEQLEQLRFLDNGYTIQTLESEYQPIAVDSALDLERVRRHFEVAK